MSRSAFTPSYGRNTILVIAAALLVGVTAYFTKIESERVLAQEIYENLEDRVSLYNTALTNEFDKVALITQLLSQHPLTVKALSTTATPEDQKETSIALGEANTRLKTSDIFLMNTDGLTVASSNPDFLNKSYAFRPYFKDAVTKGTGRFLGIGTTSKKLGFYISKAVYEGSQKVGVLVAKTDFEKTRNLVNDLNGDFLLIDEKGIIFLSSKKEFELKSLDSISVNDRLYITRTKQYPIKDIQRLDIESDSFSLSEFGALNINGETFLHTEHKISDSNWQVWMLSSTKNITKEAIFLSVVVSITIVILFFAIFVFLKRRADMERFQTIVDNLPSGVTLFDKNLKMQMCNDRLRQVLDFPEEFFDKGLPTFQELLHYNVQRGEYGPGDPEQIVAEILEKTRLQENHAFERIRPNGSTVEIRGNWLRNNSFVSTYTDITERKRAEEEATRNATYLQALLQNMDLGITVIDENLNIIYWNKAFFDLLELPDVLQKPVMRYEDLLRYNAERGEYGSGDPEAHVRSRLQATLRFESHHFERIRPNGRTLEVIGKPLIVDGKNLGFITTYVDITDHKRMVNRLKQLANSDPLTGLYNRPHFTTLLDREITRCKRNGQSLSMLLIDLDNFKDINEKFSHTTGNRILSQFATHCNGVLRNIDVMGRIGGDEFCIYLPETNRDGAFVLAERLRKFIENSDYDTETDVPTNLTISIGVSVFDMVLEDRLEDMMKRADTALSKAKAQGRNKVC